MTRQPTSPPVELSQLAEAQRRLLPCEACLPRAGQLRQQPFELGLLAALRKRLLQLELMVEFGFTPLEAIRVSTLNGAIYLGRDQRIGSIAPNKQADLLVVSGDPSKTISDIRNVVVVFKQGIGYDPAKLRDSVRGKVGLM